MNRLNVFGNALLTLAILVGGMLSQIRAEETYLAIGDGSTYICLLNTNDDNYIGKWIYQTEYAYTKVRKARRFARSKRRSARMQMLKATYSGNSVEVSVFAEEWNNWKQTLNDINDCWYGRGSYTPGSVGVSGGNGGGSNGGGSNGGGSGGSVDACAIAGDSNPKIGRIINGTVCAVGDSPVVELELSTSGGGSGCTGTVVAPRIVITAAHCAVDANDITVNTGFGSFAASSWVYHPNYNGSSQPYESNDIAIVRTSQDLPTRISKILRNNDLQVGEIGVIAGYGLDDNGNYGTLRAAPVSISNFYTEGIEIKYSGQGADGNTCSGDSGGPIFVARNNQWVLAGDTSWGVKNKCGPGDTSYFANILGNLSWLDQVAPGL